MAHADPERRPEGTALRRGWTTGACACAASLAAATAWLTGRFPDPVTITLPKGQTPAFPLALEERTEALARAGVVKDAGDDPDVTHGATVIATVRPADGLVFRAGEGVGMATKPGLPVAVGEPAINPVPRRLIAEHLDALGAPHGWEVEIAIPGGEALAAQTWNPRLGIVGGLSILGTTGVVNPYSCAAWIHSIHRGIDVARADGLPHILAATGSTSEATARALHPALPLHATIDMGDFAGGLLKYLRAHPVVIAYRATWPDERYIRTTLAGMADEVRAAKITRTALVLVGRVFGAEGFRDSALYDADHAHVLRNAGKKGRATAPATP